jgi:hypothetical protein
LQFSLQAASPETFGYTFVCFPILSIREEHRFRVFENRVLRRMFGPRSEEQENGENYITRSFLICTIH